MEQTSNIKHSSFSSMHLSSLFSYVQFYCVWYENVDIFHEKRIMLNSLALSYKWQTLKIAFYSLELQE